MDWNNINTDRDTSGLGPIEYDQSKVPQLSRKYSSDIRSKTYGKDVRESIARGVEYAGLTANESQQYSQSIGQRQNEVEKQTDDFIREFTDKETSSGPEIVSARSGFSTLEDRLDSSISTFDSIWNNPNITSIRPNDDDDAWGNYQAGPSLFLGYYDSLMNEFSNYITKENYGKDESGTYDWWVYKFTPKKYEKTMIITSGVHSSEKIAMFSLLKFLDMLCRDYTHYPQLAYIREKVRIIVAPICNPWGMVNGNGRTNVNGVNINRNFDYYWSSAGGNGDVDSGDYKGTAPNSEAETQHIVKLLDTYKEAKVYMDFHNIGMTSEDDVLVYTPAGMEIDTHPLLKVVEHFREKYGTDIKVRVNELHVSGATNYASGHLKMNALTPEFPIGRYGVVSYSGEEMTRALEWFGNLIIQYAQLTQTAKQITANDPLVKSATFNNASKTILLPNKTYASIPDLDMYFDVNSPGVVFFNGSVTVQCLDKNIVQTVRITPKLGQQGVSDSMYTPETIHDAWWETSCVSGDRVTIPFSATIPVQFSNQKEANSVVTGLFAKSEQDGTMGTSVRLMNYRANAVFIPSDSRGKWDLNSGTSTTSGSPMTSVQRWSK